MIQIDTLKEPTFIDIAIAGYASRLSHSKDQKVSFDNATNIKLLNTLIKS